MINSIIVTHPTNGAKALLYGLNKVKMNSLAELRAVNKETIKKRFSTISFDTIEELKQYCFKKQLTYYEITEDIFRSEVEIHFNLK